MSRHMHASVFLSAVLVVATAGAAAAQVSPAAAPASHRAAMPRTVIDPPGAPDPAPTPAPTLPVDSVLAPSATPIDGFLPLTTADPAPQPSILPATSPAEMRSRVDSATALPSADANPFGGQFGGAFSGQGGLMEQDRRARLIDELGAIARSRRAAGTPVPADAGTSR